MRKGKISIICMILVLVFIIISLIGPWYETLSGTNGVYLSLTSSTTTFDGITETISNADARKTAETNPGADLSILDIIDITLYLVIFVLIIAILTMVFLLGYLFNFGKTRMMKNLTMIFGVITFILALTAVFYFMVALSSKINTFSIIKDVGFWYSNIIGGISVSMGPGFAWYLLFIAGVIVLISVIFVFMDKQAEFVSQNPSL